MPTTPTTGNSAQPPRSSRSVMRALPRQAWLVIAHTMARAWEDSIFSKAAAAAFWQTLSLPPLLLGLLGCLGYVSGWFGPDTLAIVERKILSFSREIFSTNVVRELIEPTVTDVLNRGRPDIISVGFVISLWAGSSAMATFVDSIVEAHGQRDARNPVWQRIFALILYVVFLAAGVFTLPLVALGPTLAGEALPNAWREPGLRLIDFFYYPGVALLLILGLTTLYKLALHTSLPWHRLLGGAFIAGGFFLAASVGLRTYLEWLSRTGVSYGALATPIAFLLFTFSLGFAVIVGAEFNATIQQFWPARDTRIKQVRDWLSAQDDPVDAMVRQPIRAATRSVRAVTGSLPGLAADKAPESTSAPQPVSLVKSPASPQGGAR